MINDFSNDENGDVLENKKKSTSQEIKEWAQVIIVALILAFVIRTFFFEIVIVDGISMEPTLHSGDRVIVQKLGYIIGEPEHGDIIVFKTPENPKINYVKRIIGLPGDEIKIEDGTLYINDESFSEPYINEAVGFDFDEIVVPEDTFFALGDNRNFSKDSRDPHVGFVPMDNLVGQGVLRIWPLNRVSLIEWNEVMFYEY